MDAVQLTAIVGAAASLLCTLVVGALTYFLKRLLGTLEEADRKNAERIEAVNKEKTAQIEKVEEMTVISRVPRSRASSKPRKCLCWIASPRRAATP